MLVSLLVSLLVACHPVAPGLYSFETTDIHDDTCQMYSLEDFPTWVGEVAWDDKEVLSVDREEGSLVLNWDGELFTAQESSQEAMADGCNLVEDQSHVATAEDRTTLVFETVVDLSSLGSCGALALDLPCHYTRDWTGTR